MSRTLRLAFQAISPSCAPTWKAEQRSSLRQVYASSAAVGTLLSWLCYKHAALSATANAPQRITTVVFSIFIFCRAVASSAGFRLLVSVSHVYSRFLNQESR